MRCPDEGTLRAYLDNELAEARTGRTADHLSDCATCRNRQASIEAAAGQVNAWLNELAPEGLPEACAARPRVAAKTVGLRWRWGVVVLASGLAATIALFFAGAPAPQRQARAQPPPAPQPVLRVAPKSAVAVAKKLPARHPRSAPVLNEFIAFDDADPMQMGMVVRVMMPVTGESLNGGAREIAADLVIGEDGRPRAIRFLE